MSLRRPLRPIPPGSGQPPPRPQPSKPPAWPRLTSLAVAWLAMALASGWRLFTFSLINYVRKLPLGGGPLGFGNLLPDFPIDNFAISFFDRYAQPLSQWITSVIDAIASKYLAPIRVALHELYQAVWRIQNVVIPQAIKYVLGVMNKWAASGYARHKADRKNAIVKAAEDIFTESPVVRAIIGEAVRLALRLLEVENPLEKLALGFIIRELLNHLGADNVAGAAFAALLSPLTGHPAPKTLPDVIAQMTLDTQAVASWVTDTGQPFFSDLAAEDHARRIVTRALAGVAGVGIFEVMLRKPQEAARIIPGAAEAAFGAGAVVAAASGQAAQGAMLAVTAAMIADPRGFANVLARLAG